MTKQEQVSEAVREFYAHGLHAPNVLVAGDRWLHELITECLEEALVRGYQADPRLMQYRGMEIFPTSRIDGFFVAHRHREKTDVVPHPA